MLMLESELALSQSEMVYHRISGEIFLTIGTQMWCS